MPLFVSATVRQAAPRTRLPQEFRTQNLICDEPIHPLPIRMVNIGPGTSNSGEPVELYACPTCNARAAVARGHRDGQPFLLWQKAPAPRQARRW